MAELPVVDLRSDTVTRPTPAMREVIAGAEVGDDALGDDPTTRQLEEVVAELLGKERALLFPTGLMANQTALAVLGRWGGEVVLEAGAHVLNYEDGAAAALSGIQLRAVPTPDGLLTPELLRPAIHPPALHLPRTCAVAVENTHLESGGRVMPLDTAAEVAEVAREHGVGVHLDGARLWNACAASGHAPTDYASHADTVMVSLSKALGCPVGSVLAGDAVVMEEAWRVRRRLGGRCGNRGSWRLLASTPSPIIGARSYRTTSAHTGSRSGWPTSLVSGSILPPPTSFSSTSTREPTSLDCCLFYIFAESWCWNTALIAFVW